MNHLRSLPLAGAHAVWDIVFPPHCLSCGATEGLGRKGLQLCDRCLAQVTRPPESACPRCAMPIRGGVSPDGKCGDCRDRRLFFQRAVTLNEYRNLTRTLVLRLKNPNQDALAATMGRALGEEIQSRGLDRGLHGVACIPMHWARRLVRGYNAPEILALAVGRVLNLPVKTDLLYCRRLAAKQSTLLPDERRRNVSRLFGVNSGYSPAGCRLLVVDDVMTTGATLSSAAKTLRRAKVAEVLVAAIARGTGDS